MEQFIEKNGTVAGRLFAEIRHLHPNFKFCGEPSNAILSTPDGLLDYVLSLLRKDPIPPPQVSVGQWRALLHILKSHWIIPLLYWHAGRLPDELRPPAPIMDQMRAVFQWSRVRSFHMEKQLREITAAFQTEGVRLLILKGPAFGRTAYPDPALRPGSDLDLLVHPEDFIQSRNIMERIGYTCASRLFEVFRDYSCEENFSSHTHPREMLPICFHWALHLFPEENSGNNVQELLRNATEVEAGDLRFLVANPVDALIHAAAHMIIHHSQDIRLIWIYDIALLAQALKAPADWKILQERSVNWGARISVEYALNLAQILTGLQLPAEICDFSSWPEPTADETATISNTLNRHSRPDIKLRLRLAACATSRQKARFLFKFIVPKPDLMRVYYPDGTPLLFCYFRLWGRWAGEIMRFIVNCTHSGEIKAPRS